MFVISLLIFFNFLLFLLGLVGLIFSRKNIILIIMCIEVLVLSINFNFVLFSIYLDDLLGQLYCFFILTVAASESALGLALFVSYFRYFNYSFLSF